MTKTVTARCLRAARTLFFSLLLAMLWADGGFCAQGHDMGDLAVLRAIRSEARKTDANALASWVDDNPLGWIGVVWNGEDSRRVAELNVSGLGLATLPRLSGLAGLRFLDCGGNRLRELPPLPGALDALACGGNLLTALPALPKVMTELHCDGNELAALPALPPSLVVLRCNGNLLSTLPDLSALRGLVYLDCSNNGLTALPALPDGLQRLFVASNPFGALPDLSALKPSLVFLDISGVGLETLPDLSGYENLRSLSCGGNALTALPADRLPKGIETLRVSGNRLASLPDLSGFTGLNLLDCSKNRLRVLPKLPQEIVMLYLGYNEFAEIPNILPYWKTLKGLDISGIALGGFPNLSGLSLVELYCNDIGADMLPIEALPETIQFVDCSANAIKAIDLRLCENTTFQMTAPPGQVIEFLSTASDWVSNRPEIVRYAKDQIFVSVAAPTKTHAVLLSNSTQTRIVIRVEPVETKREN